MPLTIPEIHSEINSQLPDNFMNLITAAILRPVLHDMVDAGTSYTDEFLSGYIVADRRGMVGDGLTDNTAEFQAILDEAKNDKVILLGNGVYKTHRVNWTGQTIVGLGSELSQLKGYPKEDILYCPDYSISESGSTAFSVSSRLQGFGMMLDNDSTLTLGPGGDFNRPIYPVVSTWSAGLTVAEGQYYSSGGKIYQSLTDGVTGATPPTHTYPSLIQVPDGVISWLWMADAQRYVGNACIAMPRFDAAGTLGNFIGPVTGKWQDLHFQNTQDTPFNGACGVYNCLAFYDFYFEQLTMNQMVFGMVIPIGASNFANTIGFSPDVNTFINVVFRQCLTSFLCYNLNGSLFFNTQFYGEFDLLCRTFELLDVKTSSNAFTTNDQFFNIHCEPLTENPEGTAQYEYARFMGSSLRFYGGALSQGDRNDYIVWYSTFCHVLNSYVNCHNLVMLAQGNEFEKIGVGSRFGFTDYNIPGNNFQLTIKRADYASTANNLRYIKQDFDTTGDPNGRVIGQKGDLYVDRAGGASTTLWVKESGDGTNSGWVGK